MRSSMPENGSIPQTQDPSEAESSRPPSPKPTGIELPERLIRLSSRILSVLQWRILTLATILMNLGITVAALTYPDWNRIVILSIFAVTSFSFLLVASAWESRQ